MPPSTGTLNRLLKLSVREINQRLERDERPAPGLVRALEKDPRRGAQVLAKRLRAQQSANRAEGQRLRRLLKYEMELWASGYQRVAGVDEAGMAPLAGPVVAGAVILPKHYRLQGLDDSKKILSPEKREELAAQIKKDALAWGTGWESVEEIDTLNIYHAGLLAMSRAVSSLQTDPDFCLVDARTIPHCSIPQRGIIHGDELSSSIAAASIIAKTTRDAFMIEISRTHPGYGFESHKGYPTPEHCAALRKLGALEIHRRSFNRVKEVLGLPMTVRLTPRADEEQQER